MRENFSKKTKEILARRVGFQCSNPKCRKPTSGPDSTDSGVINIGVAAHIAAASEGGPRFDPALKPEERAAEANGLWLCQNCAKLIDSDPAKYTKEVLLDWKETAEHWAAAGIQGTAASATSASEHSIKFIAEDWSMWRDRGNLPHDPFIDIDCWSRGDVRYSVRLRLKNNLTHKEVLHRFRMEFKNDSEIVFSDENAFNGDDVILAPGEWVNIDVNHGLRDFKFFQSARSVWCKAEVVGDDEVLRWQVAEIDHASVNFPAD